MLKAIVLDTVKFSDTATPEGFEAAGEFPSSVTF